MSKSKRTRNNITIRQRLDTISSLTSTSMKFEEITMQKIASRSTLTIFWSQLCSLGSTIIKILSWRKMETQEIGQEISILCDHGKKKITLKNGLESYFNCHNFPYLVLIENIWQPVKPTLRKYPNLDDVTTKELIYEGSTYVSQKLINKKIASISERSQAVKDSEEKMTSYWIYI